MIGVVCFHCGARTEPKREREHGEEKEEERGERTETEGPEARTGDR